MCCALSSSSNKDAWAIEELNPRHFVGCAWVQRCKWSCHIKPGAECDFFFLLHPCPWYKHGIKVYALHLYCWSVGVSMLPLFSRYIKCFNQFFHDGGDDEIPHVSSFVKGTQVYLIQYFMRSNPRLSCLTGKASDKGGRRQMQGIYRERII